MDETVKEKIQRQDHDSIIRIETKLDQVGMDIKNLKDGTVEKLAELDTHINKVDARLQDVERYPIEYNIPDLVGTIQASSTWISKFKLTWRLVIVSTSAISSIITFILTLIVASLTIFKK